MIDDKPLSPYCSTPDQIDQWFKAFKKAKEMCGQPGIERAPIQKTETEYLDKLVRGVYAKRDLPEGHVLSDNDIYLAIPLQKGQLSCRELIGGDVLVKQCTKDGPLMVDMFDNPYSRHEELRASITNRGL